MTLDVRAETFCNLGPIISASVSDSYIQESGLITTTGSCTIDGVITPSPGTVVTFSYLKDGISRSIPRKLRVLSSFADPFRKITQVELGCKLTYMSDLQEPIDWTAFDDPANAEVPPEDEEVVVVPITAASILDQCLSQIGITASSNPLTNKFSIESFDFSGGYVNIAGALLVSESYCGYLDTNEVLQIFPLTTAGGTGPVLSKENIIDISGIGSGGLPGEAVVVSYSTLVLKKDPPDELTDEEKRRRNWEYDESVGAETLVTLRYDKGDGNPELKFFTYRPVSVTDTRYSQINGQDQVVYQKEESFSIAAAEYGNFFEQCIKEGLPVSGESQIVSSVTETFYDYSTSFGGLTTNTVTKKATQPYGRVIGSLSVPFALDGQRISLSLINVETEKTISISESIGDTARTRTDYYKLWPYTIQGQQAIAENFNDFENISQVSSYVDSILSSGLQFAGSETSRQGAGQQLTAGRPAPQIMVLSDYVDFPLTPSPGSVSTIPGANGKKSPFGTESKGELELAIGSPTAQRRIEFSLPYAPDDTFEKLGAGYKVTKSDARQKANKYGRIQNKILLGNRNGMNIQSTPELIPHKPFSPIIIKVDNGYALYRTNGNTWTIDSTGIIATTDALMWGAIGAS